MGGARAARNLGLSSQRHLLVTAGLAGTDPGTASRICHAAGNTFSCAGKRQPEFG
jgi:hypothetical protein